jgi:endoglucanase
MKKIVVILLVMVLTGGIALAQMPIPTGLQWDANSEADLAGYYVYEATTSNGQVLTAFSYPPVLAPEHSLTFVDPHADGQYYWKVTAYDTAANESGFSLEVTAEFNVVPPAPPVGCSVTY